MDAVQIALALAAGLLGGAVAAVITGFVALEQQRRHDRAERDLAREARLEARRARVYERSLEHAFRIQAWTARTYPMWGPTPAPPEPLPEAELLRLDALIGVHASPEVQRLTRVASARARAFQNLAIELDGEEHLGRPKMPDTRQKLHETRVALIDDVQQLGERMAAELRHEA